MTAAELAPCCADAGNRLPIHTHAPRGWYVEICGVCGRRHITLRVREATLIPAAPAPAP